MDTPTAAPALPAAAHRLHALDNLRALMMWLGIVLHVAVIHVVRASPLPWRDEQRTRVADLLLAAIHAFRMPVFFILAGFFVALLLQKRGPRGLARHRLLRLGLPFALFWPPVFAAGVLCALLFMHRMVRGTWGVDPGLMAGATSLPRGPSTMHLWFLWMLLWFSLGTAAVAALGRRMPRRLVDAAGALLQRLGAAWWGFAVLALPLVAAAWRYPDGLLTPSGAFLPPLSEWLHNGLFFAFGLALFHQQWTLFDSFRRRAAAYLAAGLPFFLATGVLIESHAHPGWIAFAYNCTSWLWSFALIGLALRWLARPNAWLAYLADSSYWVYLVHLPLTIGFGALLYGVPWPAGLKMIANIAATTAVCLASYALLARHTWVSVLLNGKRHPRRPNGVPAHAASR
ncbi:MAG: acyltransferase family protein [Pseudomonadota bacterium]